MWHSPTAAYMSYMYTGAGAEVLIGDLFLQGMLRTALTGVLRARVPRVPTHAVAAVAWRSPCNSSARPFSTVRDRRHASGDAVRG
jgi:hypothetical protein